MGKFLIWLRVAKEADENTASKQCDLVVAVPSSEIRTTNRKIRHITSIFNRIRIPVVKVKYHSASTLFSEFFAPPK